MRSASSSVQYTFLKKAGFTGLDVQIPQEVTPEVREVLLKDREEVLQDLSGYKRDMEYLRPSLPGYLDKMRHINRMIGKCERVLQDINNLLQQSDQ